MTDRKGLEAAVDHLIQLTRHGTVLNTALIEGTMRVDLDDTLTAQADEDAARAAVLACVPDEPTLAKLCFTIYLGEDVPHADKVWKDNEPIHDDWHAVARAIRQRILEGR